MAAVAVTVLRRQSVRSRDDQFGALVAEVEPKFFDFVGGRALIGRRLFEDDFASDADGAVVVSSRLWTRRFHGDGSMLGSRLQVDDALYSVVGVMPEQFRYPDAVDLWIPRRHNDLGVAQTVAVAARLASGATVAAIEGALNGRSDVEGALLGRSLTPVVVAPIRQADIERAQPFEQWMLAVSALVSVILINVVSLSLLRAMRRQRDVAIELALGSNAAAAVRGLLLETAIVAVAGVAVGGVAVGVLGHAISAALERVYSYQVSVGLHWQVLVVVTLACIGVGAATAGIPGLLIFRNVHIEGLLREFSSGRSVGLAGHRARNVLLLLEVAGAIALAAGGVALVRSADHIRGYEVGFDATRLWQADVAAPSGVGVSTSQLIADATTLERGLRLVRRVDGVAVWGERYPRRSMAPLASQMALEAGEANLPASAVPPMVYSVNNAFFDAIRLPLKQGRVFGDGDARMSTPVVILNEAAARRWFAQRVALGQRVRLGTPESGEPWRVVVGVVANAWPVSPSGVFGALQNGQYFPLAFVPLIQSEPPGLSVAVHASGSGPVAPDLAVAVAAAGVSVRVSAFANLQETLTSYGALGRVPFAANVTMGFTVIALGLASLGAYSVVAESARRRRGELGIRLALGAAPGKLVLWQLQGTMGTAGIGALLGVVLTLVLSRALKSLMFGLPALSVPSLATSVSAVLLACVLGALWPAMDVLHLNPSDVLRAQ